MGHIRLGRLPKTKKWLEVVEALGVPEPSAGTIASSTARAAAREFQLLKGSPTLASCLWILARVGTSARHGEFAGDLRQLGIDSSRAGTGFGFAAEIGLAVTREAGDDAHTLFGQMALASLRDVFAHAVVEQSRSLFDTTLDDVRAAAAAFGSDPGFGAAVRDFYGNFMSRVLRFVAEKELANHISGGGEVSAVERAQQVSSDLDRYCRESARVVEDFASGWFSKQNWRSGREIAKEDARGFSAYAVEKLRMEMAGESE